MRRTTVLLLVLLVLVGAAAGAFYIRRLQSGQMAAGFSGNPGRSHRYTMVIPSGTSLKDALEIVRRRYLLKPDGRVLRALSEIKRFPARARKSESIQALWTGTSWRIHLAGRDTAFLHRLPGFGALLALLKKQAAIRVAAMHLTAGNPAFTQTRSLPDTADAEPLIVRLKALDRSTKPLSLRLEAAARVLARLAVLQPDSTGFGFELPTHGLAVLALAEAADHVRLYESESELAYALGYKHAALSLTQHLKEKNPWRLFVTHRDNALAMQTGTNGSATTFAMYLELSRLAKRQEEAQWSALAASMPSSGSCAEGIYAQGLKLSPMMVHARFSLALPLLTIRCMSMAGLEGDVQPPAQSISSLSNDAALIPASTLIGQFENLLSRQAKKFTGPFLTPEVYRAFRREAFYTGLYARFDLALSWRSVIGEAEEQAEDTESVNIPDARRLGLWEKDMVAAWQGKIDPVRAAMDMAKDKSLAPQLKLRLISLAIGGYSTSDRLSTEAIVRTVPGLDSRPAVREPLGDLLWDHLAALAPAMVLYKAAVKASARPDQLSVWLAGYLEGDKGLLAIARDPDVSLMQQDFALGQIEHPDKYAARIIRRFQAILQQVPKAKMASVYEDYLDMLHRLRRPTREVAVAYRFVHELPSYTSSLGVVEAKIYLARAYRHDGNLEEAWNTIEPELSSWKADALGEGVRILMAMGRFKAAGQIAQGLHERYPDSLPNLLPLVEVQWRMGEYQRAAKTLLGWDKTQLSAEWYPDVTKAFVRTFADREKARRKAVQALLGRGASAVNMQWLVFALAKKGAWQAAYETILDIPVRRGHLNLRQIAQAYLYLQHWKGRKRANAWLVTQVPHRAQFVFAMYLYHAYAYHGLWQFMQLPRTNADADITFDWILRSAAQMQGVKISGKQARAIKAYFGQPMPPDRLGRYYMELGRYLLGIDSKLAFINAKLPRRKLTEAAYYLALHAASEGHYTRAENWLRVSISGYFRHDGELYWSMALLSAWVNSNRSPAILHAQGRLFRPPFARSARNPFTKPLPTGGT